MKNLENYGVQELNTQELNRTNGGFGAIVAVLALTGAGMNWAWELGRETARQ